MMWLCCLLKIEYFVCGLSRISRIFLKKYEGKYIFLWFRSLHFKGSNNTKWTFAMVPSWLPQVIATTRILLFLYWPCSGLASTTNTLMDL